MSIAFVQETFSAQPNVGSTAHVVTLSSGVTTGNTLLVAAILDGGFTVSSVSGCGATWTQIATTIWPGATSYRTVLWKGAGATTGTSITVTTSSACDLDANASEWSGVDTITASATSDQTTAAAGTSLSLATGDYGYTAFGWNVNPTHTRNDLPANWTLLTGGFDGSGTGVFMDAAYRQAAGTETAQHAWTLGFSDSWGAVTAQLSPAAPAPAFRQPSITVRSRAVSRASVI